MTHVPRSRGLSLPTFGLLSDIEQGLRQVSTEADSIQFFQRKSVALAMAMPVGEARNFLRGLLLTAEDPQLLDDIRAAYIQLCEADQRLDSIAKRPSTPSDQAKPKS